MIILSKHAVLPKFLPTSTYVYTYNERSKSACELKKDDFCTSLLDLDPKKNETCQYGFHTRGLKQLTLPTIIHFLRLINISLELLAHTKYYSYSIFSLRYVPIITTIGYIYKLGSKYATNMH